MNRRAFLGVGVAAFASSLAGCTGRGLGSGPDATETVTTTFDPASVDRIAVRSDVGPVRLVGDDDAEDVVVGVVKRSPRGTAGLDDLLVETTLTDRRLLVTAVVADDPDWFGARSPNTDVTVTVPAGADGPPVERVDTTVGEVTLLGTRGDTVVRAEVGRVTADGVDGYLDVRAAVGEVRIADTTGIDAVRTELGDVRGDLLGIRGDTEIRTDLGSVSLGVADDVDFELAASASGGVDSDLPLTGVRAGDRRLRGRHGDGGPRLRVRSELGEVTLRTVPADARAPTGRVAA